MTKLSSNWAKLNSKIRKEKGVKKIRKPTIAKPKTDTPKSTLNLLKEIPKPKRQETETNELTPIEYTLWVQDSQINQSDISITSKHINQIDSRKKEPGKYIAIDCEFVGVGPEGEESALARVSIVNFYGYVLLDVFVKPKEKVTDWRTWVSGIQPYHLKNAISFKQAQEKVSKLFQDKILIGHGINNDLECLFLSHPKKMIRDTSRYPPFREIAGGKTPSLKKLVKQVLNIDIQAQSHSSVEDARATMLLFRLHRKNFEKWYQNKKIKIV
ncbi:unnamed protein product [Candida verbasci]|uniref:RNA exonuclease 4 n=1 Tax=Candida verbasci TaxID=1227364 RepID=A0A9W4TVP0_9ASCO|nr:unnamed protein product [Candida verbasci]